MKTGTIDILMARKQFVDRWCGERGRNRDALTMEEILEIRRDERWIRPLESPHPDEEKEPE